MVTFCSTVFTLSFRMRTPILSLAALVLIVFAACGGDGPTGPFVADVATRVTGRVLLPDGAPAPARVTLFINVPQAASLLFSPSASLETDARGEFDVTLHGVAPSPRPIVDTVRVTVGALQAVDPYPNTRSVVDTVLITLRPPGPVLVPTTVTLRLPAP